MAVICIAIVEIYALASGHDGTILAMALAAMAGLAGWVAPQPKIFEK